MSRERKGDVKEDAENRAKSRKSQGVQFFLAPVKGEQLAQRKNWIRQKAA